MKTSAFVGVTLDGFLARPDGSIDYLKPYEGEEHGFTSIPVSIYWAVATLTTVGYGDLAPVTPLGQSLAVLLMLTGYAIIAVPTRIVTAELARAASAVPVSAQACPGCGLGAHEHDAVYCRKCGAKL